MSARQRRVAKRESSSRAVQAPPPPSPAREEPLREDDDITTIPDFPEDLTLFVGYDHHIARHIWEGILRKWDLFRETDEVVGLVEIFGLLPLAMYAHRSVDKVLVNAFIERFYPETNTFHLPFGEMTITLIDVQHILGIPFLGVNLNKDNGFQKRLTLNEAKNLMLETLGMDVNPPEVEESRQVKLEWLRSFFSGRKVNLDYEDQEFTSRAYLLYLVGCCLYPDKTGNKVSIYHLRWIRDIYNISTYALGQGALVSLFDELGAASRCGTKSFTG
ncbi:Aminotransferase-like [Macleaya cordata]|uniref:Aminotransferase-like n=1 Tax=Macleaya cordata TaxID=56857 RepID=A0A200QVI7_MACCD|nr:Aminotransferase-like [Macleaya cordata]